MTNKLKLLSSIILILMVLKPIPMQAQLAIQSSPIWSFCASTQTDTFNYIPDTTEQSHVTGIHLGLTSTGAIFQINIIGDGIQRTAKPLTGCGDLSSSSTTLTIGANERVIKIETWRNSDFKWYRIKLTLNTGSITEYDRTPTATTNTPFTFTIPKGKEFTGFSIYAGCSDCLIEQLLVVVRPATCS